jgi:hypothetical protein
MQWEKLSRIILLILFCCGVLFVILSTFSILTGWPGGYTGEQLGPPSENIPVVTQGIQNQTPLEENISVITRDIQNQTPLGGVDYYINGQFAGTSLRDGYGSFTISAASYPSETVTIRAVKDGYLEKTTQVDLTNIHTLELDLQVSGIIPLLVNGPQESKINVVFLPSNTSFNSSTNTKVLLNGYPGGQQQFEDDVIQFINQTFGMYPSHLSQYYPISGSYMDKFNFYYFWDGKTYVDAFNGCAGEIPDNYWHDVTFADLTIVLYPTYYGIYLGPPSMPIGCTNPNGLGRVYSKVAADEQYLAMHEIGHGLYGLMDTYCGGTWYSQNDPNPNLWDSEEKCQAAAVANNWNPNNCRQIEDTANNCQKGFWRWDPDPDIMHAGYYGTFGNASSLRITTISNKY